MSKKILLTCMILSFMLAISACQRLKKPRKTYVREHAEISSEIKKAILEKRVIPGMNKEQLLTSWGNPIQKHRWGRKGDTIKEEYCYDFRHDPPSRDKLYVITLVNDTVIKVEQRKKNIASTECLDSK